MLFFLSFFPTTCSLLCTAIHRPPSPSPNEQPPSCMSRRGFCETATIKYNSKVLASSFLACTHAGARSGQALSHLLNTVASFQRARRRVQRYNGRCGAALPEFLWALTSRVPRLSDALRTLGGKGRQERGCMHASQNSSHNVEAVPSWTTDNTVSPIRQRASCAHFLFSVSIKLLAGERPLVHTWASLTSLTPKG
jgi:hypothetical protein